MAALTVSTAALAPVVARASVSRRCVPRRAPRARRFPAPRASDGKQIARRVSPRSRDGSRARRADGPAPIAPAPTVARRPPRCDRRRAHSRESIASSATTSAPPDASRPRARASPRVSRRSRV
eukprot:31527-Pelagococcus_subviridis.AAC.9